MLTQQNPNNMYNKHCNFLKGKFKLYSSKTCINLNEKLLKYILNPSARVTIQ